MLDRKLPNGSRIETGGFMRTTSALAALCLSFALALPATMAPAAHHEGGARAASIVLVIDTNGQVRKFMEFVARANAIAEELGVAGKQRTWWNNFGGAQSNSVASVVEYPSLVALAEATTKMNANPKWQQLVNDVRAAGMQLISRSVMEEVTP
jgi:hypothetical protein